MERQRSIKDQGGVEREWPPSTILRTLYKCGWIDMGWSGLSRPGRLKKDWKKWRKGSSYVQTKRHSWTVSHMPENKGIPQHPELSLSQAMALWGTCHSSWCGSQWRLSRAPGPQPSAGPNLSNKKNEEILVCIKFNWSILFSLTEKAVVNIIWEHSGIKKQLSFYLCKDTFFFTKLTVTKILIALLIFNSKNSIG